MSTDYEILLELVNIFKADSRTKGYTIQAAEDPDDLPGPEGCPVINIFPKSKARSLSRMSSTPYSSVLSFDMICWEMGVKDYLEAFRLMVLVEANVFAVLSSNVNVSGKVNTSVIEDTTFEHVHYADTFYIRAVIPFSVLIDQ